jgi:hypothetical protein
MAKKIEIDIAYLKSIGISQVQIQEIIKKAEPNHWTNNLPQNRGEAYTVRPFLFTPEISMQGSLEVYADREIEPTVSFYTEEDADFVIQKCNLLIEMSNYAFSVNGNWIPYWDKKEQKKYGIVLQNSTAMVKENEIFNIYVFGIALKSKGLALEMLEEFKPRIEKLFNNQFNSKDFLNFENIKSDENKEEVKQIKPRKYLEQTDIPKIKEMLLAGVRQKVIANELGYSEGLISRVKGGLGFSMRKRTLNLNNS